MFNNKSLDNVLIDYVKHEKALETLKDNGFYNLKATKPQPNKIARY